MREGARDYSKDPSLKKILDKYHSMRAEGKTAYFDVEEFCAMADYYNGICDAKQADAIVEYALKIHPNNSELLTLKAHSLVFTDRLDEAEALLEQIPGKQDYEYMLTMAELHLAKDEEAEAKAWVEKLYEQEPETYTALDIAEIYISYGVQKEAERWLLVAGPDDSDDWEIVQTYTKFYFASGGFKKVESILVRRLDGDPYNLEAWQMLIRCRILLGEIEKAQADMEFAMAIDDQNPDNMELQGNLYLQTEEYDKAAACLKRAEALQPDKTLARYSLMNLYAMQKRFPEAMPYCDIVIAGNTLGGVDLSRVYQIRANAHLQLADYEGAVSDIQKGLECDPRNDGLYLLAGRVCLHNKLPEAAKEAFLQAEKYSDDMYDTKLDIGGYYVSEGYYEEAVKLFLQMLDEFSKADSVVTSYYLAYCYYMLDQKSEIDKYLIQCLFFLRWYPKGAASILPHDDELKFKFYIVDRIGEEFELDEA